MEYRRLGRTGWQVSAVGMGGIPIQRVNEAEAQNIISEALGQGINFFDSARGYTDSERKFGEAFSCEQRGNYYIATKCRGFTKEAMEKEIETSLQNLSVDYIDLYQIHNVRSMDILKQVMRDDGALVALKEARKAGKIKEIGVTGHVLPILMEALQSGEFATVQFPFNAIETAASEKLMKVAESLDIGMIAMKPLAGGAITKGELALRYILEYPIATVIPGMDKVEQVIANTSLVKNKFIPLTPAEKIILTEEIEALGNSFCRRCDYCSPCPQGIDIPSVFILNGYWERYNLQDWAIDRYNNMQADASACEACGHCQERCPYELPIINMLSEAHQNLIK